MVAEIDEARQCSLTEQTTKHESGLRTMPLTGPRLPGAVVVHVVSFPSDCCPVSHNPREGSTLTLRYRPTDCTLEVYALQAVLRQFRGGFPGAGRYPAERNMEGSVTLLAQMAADALGVPVRVRARLLLDTGAMRVVCEAQPCR